AVRAAVGFGDVEQAVVEAHLGGDGVARADPVDGALDLAVGAGQAVAGLRIERGAQLADPAGGVLDDFLAADDADPAQAHLAARDQALEALGRYLGEVLALDPDLARERHLAGAKALVLRMIRKREGLLVVG